MNKWRFETYAAAIFVSAASLIGCESHAQIVPSGTMPQSYLPATQPALKSWTILEPAGEGRSRSTRWGTYDCCFFMRVRGNDGDDVFIDSNEPYPPTAVRAVVDVAPPAHIPKYRNAIEYLTLQPVKKTFKVNQFNIMTFSSYSISPTPAPNTVYELALRAGTGPYRKLLASEGIGLPGDQYFYYGSATFLGRKSDFVFKKGLYYTFALFATSGVSPTPGPEPTQSAPPPCKIVSKKPFREECTYNPTAITIPNTEGGPVLYGLDPLQATPKELAHQTNPGFPSGPGKLIFASFCLNAGFSYAQCPPKYKAAPLTRAILAKISHALDNFRTAGVKMVLRFTYGPGEDAPMATVLKELRQLAPLILEHRDVIFAWQAGFLGAYGEWKTSTNGNLTPQKQREFLNEEQKLIGDKLILVVRNPGTPIIYLHSWTPSPLFALHDDGYGGSLEDEASWGAYLDGPRLRRYVEQVARTTFFMGETAGYSSNLSCRRINDYNESVWLQALVTPPNPEDIALAWQYGACFYGVYDRVGVRLVATSAAISGSVAPGGKFTLTLSIRNDGYGRILLNRSSDLAFILNNKIVNFTPVSADLRTIMPGGGKTFKFLATVPQSIPSNATYSVAFRSHDPAKTLVNRVAYDLPLDSIDSDANSIWNSKLGTNLLFTVQNGSKR